MGYSAFKADQSLIESESLNMNIYWLIGGMLVILAVGITTGIILQKRISATRSRLAELRAREAVEEAK
jgi:hypothetical protein